jgi:FAD/FMN-containing dehydrogenase
MRRYESWGRFPRATHTAVLPVTWRSEPPPLGDLDTPVLPFACGRSYGDSCLNNGGVLLDVAPLKRFIAFDDATGILRCEAGVTLAEILELVVPRGWFPPVVPGTKWVSIGGAIANDIHGKNHHVAGTFGCHVTGFELLRSSGERLFCSPEHNVGLFQATIGGLGLTGLILWAELHLKRIPGAAIAMERIRFRRLEEFLELSAADSDHEYTVAWVDCLARRSRLGRGLFLRGDHTPAQSAAVLRPATAPSRLRVPFDPPGVLLNSLTASAFNAVYYRSQLRAKVKKVVPYDPFFFPLDGVHGWNRLYGRRGFLQYQCVVPDEGERGPIRTILERISRAREASFLAVLKRFGSVPSPGLLSFPRPGITLALDFRYRGRPTLRLLDHLDEVVRAAGGAVYPAKDARMSGESFRRYFPAWETFAAYVDPQFSSSFWRRVQPA